MGWSAEERRLRRKLGPWGGAVFEQEEMLEGAVRPLLSARLWAPSRAGRRGSHEAAVPLGMGRRWPLPKDLLALWKREGDGPSGEGRAATQRRGGLCPGHVAEWGWRRPQTEAGNRVGKAPRCLWRVPHLSQLLWQQADLRNGGS